MTKLESHSKLDLNSLSSSDLDKVLNAEGLPKGVYDAGDKVEFFREYKPKYGPDASEYVVKVTPEVEESISRILEE